MWPCCWEDVGQSQAIVQPWFLGCQSWGRAASAGCCGFSICPFPGFIPAPGPGSVASGRIALFVSLDALHFLRKQPIVFSGSPSLCLSLAPCPVAGVGTPLSLFSGAPSSLQPPAPCNAHQHSKDRSGVLAPRTAPVWGWGWVTTIWEAGGRVRLDHFLSPFRAVSALWSHSASMQLTDHCGLGFLPQQTHLECPGCQEGRGHLSAGGVPCVSELLSSLSLNHRLG